MRYYSLNRQSPDVDFREATIRGQAPDKGLYFPERVPKLAASFFEQMGQMSKEEVAYEIMQPYIGNTIDTGTLKKIVAETINFPFPLVPVNEQIDSLELFHGPTLAFKDVGARFMSRCLGYFSRNQDKKTTVLVATSGDTGGAVANGFLGVDGVEVIILYPSGKVSQVQELQLTTCGQNITALEVKGSFDDCQAMVKDAFMDADLQQYLQLTSANSINVARWLPQQLYYFFALQQWTDKENFPVISVPSGNFGNICAGLLARYSGLPIPTFIAACNVNDTISAFLTTGIHTPKETISTVSNAMDVGNPSNLIRIIELFKIAGVPVKNILQSVTVTDAETIDCISSVYDKYGYLLDPHGAVAYHALEKCTGPDQKGIMLETAHPVKFPDTVKKAIGKEPQVPDVIQPLFQLQKQAINISPSFSVLKEWLLSR
ncbi:threonine synthase [Sediminibacterium sp.]|uniref:threonine synthase n=1 Tax=Sediminibacterium sp. TaxID=1917865 RepID=UPI0025CF3D6F|nr:threonine synthase [Sediminibacterium sp.]MBW0177256.1 threonine synthase [Sediminibacterium sp.]